MANVPLATKMRVMGRSDGRCELCGGRKRVHMHHIIFRRHNNHRPENLIVVCEDHNPHQYPEIDLSLKSMLCEFYKRQGRSREEIRDLCGGRYYTEELDSEYKAHLRLLERRYGNG